MGSLRLGRLLFGVLAVLSILLPFKSLFAKELIVGFSYAKPPYVFAQTTAQTGDMRGIELEIMTKALALRGHTFKPRFFPYSRLNDALKSGKVDAIATVRPELDWVFYSRPYVHYQNYAIARADSAPGISDIASLSGRSVAAWEGATKDLGSSYAEAVRKSPLYKEIGDQQQQVLLFLRQRVDTLVIDGLIFRYWARILGYEPDDFDFHDIFGGKTTFVVGFTSKLLREDFNIGLNQLRNDGSYERIYEKFFNFRP